MAAKAERLGLLSTLLALVLAGVVYGFARWAGGASPLVTATFLVLGLLVAAVSYFHLRLVRRVLEERLEEQELSEEAGEDSSLFTAPTEENIEAFTAGHALQQFERYIVPGFTLVLSGLHLVLGLLLLRRLGDLAGIPAGRSTALAALLVSVAFVLYVAGKIQAAMADEKDYRLLLAPAGYLLLCAGVALLSGIAAAAAHFKIPAGDKIVAWVGVIVLLLLGVEYLVTAILEIYRPRIGEEARPLYESRLCELLARPRSLFESIAQAVDYQFGFHVSETWFYQLLERAVLPLILVQVVSLYLLSCFAFVGPQEEGILERFGRPQVNHTLQPGAHLKFPWPIDKVVKFPAKQALTITLDNAAAKEEKPEEQEQHQRVILWTRGHHHRNFWLVASHQAYTQSPPPPAASAAGGGPTPSPAMAASEAVPVNLVSLHAVVQYRIKDVYQYAYGFSDAKEILSDLAYRLAVKRLVSVDLSDLLQTQRLTIAKELEKKLQAQADAMKLGVEITFVGIENVHPPMRVADAFETVIGATEEAKSSVLDAETYANKSIPTARADAAKIEAAAEGDRARRNAVSEAEAYAFSKQRYAELRGGAVYRTRAYLDALERSLGPIRKYIITAKKTREVTILNLEDKLRADLLDIVPTSSEKEKTEKK